MEKCPFCKKPLFEKNIYECGSMVNASAPETLQCASGLIVRQADLLRQAQGAAIQGIIASEKAIERLNHASMPYTALLKAYIDKASLLIPTIEAALKDTK